MRLFTEARAVRKGIIQAGQDTAAPDFGRQAAAASQRKREEP
jgi:cyclohexadieny/prephenate dehydrogenase